MKTVIIGSGIAGLMSARILANFNGEVIVIERDELPQTPRVRAGTPQAYHPHHLTLRGRILLEHLFPGLNEALLKNGAHNSQDKEILFYYPFGNISLKTPVSDAACSRSLLEWQIRQYVQQMENVRFISGTKATDLKVDTVNNRIYGVAGRGDDGSLLDIDADRVVFAAGYHSRLSDWLKRYGYDIPQPEILTTKLGYSTRHYAVANASSLTWDTLHIENPKGSGPTCVVSFMENEMMEVILGNTGGMYPPTDTGSFEKELKKFNNPVLNAVLQNAVPLEAPRGYRMPEVYCRHFDKMSDLPAGLLIMGDALCNFDPIHGTGITIAAIQAELLQKKLAENQKRPFPDFELNYLQHVQHAIEPAWWINAVSDFGNEAVQHIYLQPLKGVRLAKIFIDHVITFATTANQISLLGLVWLVKTSFLSPHELINKAIFDMLRSAGFAGELTELINEGNMSDPETWEQGRCPDIPSFDDSLFMSKEILQQ